MTILANQEKKPHYLMGLMGLTAFATVTINTPAVAEPRLYLETGGQESLNLDPNGLAILEGIGLTLSSANSTTTPKPGFDIGALMLPPSSTPGVRGTTAVFLYDDDDGFYFPVSGTEEFLGTLVFDVDNNLLPGLDSQFVFGNFSNIFDETFTTVIRDTSGISLPPLFPALEVANDRPPNVDLTTGTWFLEDIEIVISQELSDFLVAAGASQSVAGVPFAEARGDRTFVLLSVPEPSMITAILTTGLAAFSLRKRKSN